MNLQEFIEIEQDFMEECDDFSISKKASKILQARNFGGVPCYSKSRKEHGIVIVFIINGLDEMQTDAKTFIQTLFNPENIDVEKLFSIGFYGLKYVFLSHDDDSVIEASIFNCNHINPFDEDYEGDFEILRLNAKNGSFSHLDVLTDELIASKVSEIQKEHDVAKKTAIKNQFMNDFFLTNEDMSSILKPCLALV